MPNEPTDSEFAAIKITPADIIAGEAADPLPHGPLQAQEPVVPQEPVPPLDTGYTPDGVPTFDSVREKIETRYGTAIGASELAAGTPEGRTVEDQYEARQRAAATRLEQIRESMHLPSSDDKPADS